MEMIIVLPRVTVGLNEMMCVQWLKMPAAILLLTWFEWRLPRRAFGHVTSLNFICLRGQQR